MILSPKHHLQSIQLEHSVDINYATTLKSLQLPFWYSFLKNVDQTKSNRVFVVLPLIFQSLYEPNTRIKTHYTYLQFNVNIMHLISRSCIKSSILSINMNQHMNQQTCWSNTIIKIRALKHIKIILFMMTMVLVQFLILQNIYTKIYI